MVRFETPISAYKCAKLIASALNIFYKVSVKSGELIARKAFLKKYPLPKVKNQRSWELGIAHVP